jgi:hypothetical protein
MALAAKAQVVRHTRQVAVTVVQPLQRGGNAQVQPVLVRGRAQLAAELGPSSRCGWCRQTS